MIDREIDIQTKDGVMNTFITHPEEDGPHPLVLFLMDAPGKREELHDMARRLGSAGYYVVLPNLYYRRVREFRLQDASREEMFAHMDSLTNAMVCEDAVALMEFADRESEAGDGKIGCLASVLHEMAHACPRRFHEVGALQIGIADAEGLDAHCPMRGAGVQFRKTMLLQRGENPVCGRRRHPDS